MKKPQIAQLTLKEFRDIAANNLGDAKMQRFVNSVSCVPETAIVQIVMEGRCVTFGILATKDGEMLEFA